MEGRGDGAAAAKRMSRLSSVLKNDLMKPFSGFGGKTIPGVWREMRGSAQPPWGDVRPSSLVRGYMRFCA